MAVERQIELKRRHHRKLKMKKLKAKLATATGPEREKVMYKIKRLSPWWTEASLTQKLRTEATAAPAERKAAPRPKAPAAAGPKGPPKGGDKK